MSDLPDINYLLRRYSYNPDTGILTKTGSTLSVRYGNVVGTRFKGVNTTYLLMRVQRKTFYVHRIVWLMHNKVPPNGHIDHIDGDGTNNSISNLRVVDRTTNMRNARRQRRNKSGHTGIFYSIPRKKWIAYIRVDNKQVHLGYFDDKLKAIEARKEAERLYGFHETHGEIRVK